MRLLTILLITIVSYNVENLFHPAHDSVAGEPKDDLEWTPEGERRWSYTRYYRKEENIARVLTNIGEWDGVDVVGLQEIENALVVKRLCYTLRRNEYDFVHYESPDKRGIDVALIYKKSRVDTLSSKAIPVKLSQTSSNPQTTRDILYVNALIQRYMAHFFYRDIYLVMTNRIRLMSGDDISHPHLTILDHFLRIHLCLEIPHVRHLLLELMHAGTRLILVIDDRRFA